MTSKKSFKNNPAMQFISSGEETQETAQAAQEGQQGFTVPEGYILTQEPKSKRLQLLVRPHTLEALKQTAAAQGLSVNELCNRILEDYTKGVE